VSRARRLLVPAALAAGLVLPASLAAADSFTPITMSLSIAPVARLHVPLKTRVHVSADPGVLDTSEGPMRVEVKLASECGGSYQTTPGVKLINAPLKPQPATGKAYSGSVSGSGRPNAYGERTVCMYLEDSAVGRVYANDESNQVNVSKPCTTAAHRYDSAKKALNRARRQRRRARTRKARRRDRRLVAKRKRTLAKDKRQGIKACGRGVAL
jgi:hypothetical protein